MLTWNSRRGGKKEWAVITFKIRAQNVPTLTKKDSTFSLRNAIDFPAGQIKIHM